MKIVSKVWGTEHWVHEDGGASLGYTMKILKYRSKFKSSLHYHPVKNETMYVVEGTLAVKWKPIGAQAFIEEVFGPGSYITFPAGTQHQVWCFPTDGFHYCKVIEASTPHSDDDVVRLEESGPWK